MLSHLAGCVLTTTLCLNPTWTPKADMKRGLSAPVVLFSQRLTCASRNTM
jgi:hypothetical protein